MKIGKVRRIGVLAYSILSFFVLVALCMTQRVTRPVASQNGVAYDQKIDLGVFRHQIEQQFVPQYEQLDMLKVYVDASECAKETGSLLVMIMDENQKIVFDSAYDFSELPAYGWLEIATHLRLSTEHVYRILIKSVDCTGAGPKLSFFDAALAAAVEQQGHHLIYAGIEDANMALRITFTYKVPIKAYEYLVYYIFGLIIVFVL